ncbi:MAG: dephospho-CoA kinase [Bacteroidota bacterium]
MNNLQIGVTGGIGSGKSLICKIFSTLGVPIYDADSRAKWLMNNQKELKAKIKSNFGERAYDEKDEINRGYLADKVFNDSNALDGLNALVHPAVGQDYQAWKEQQKSHYTIKEAALMFESESYKGLDYVVNVSAPEEIRIQRVLKRDTFRSETEIRAIIEKQLPETERIRRSDFVITNDGKQMVISQVLELHERFSK